MTVLRLACVALASAALLAACSPAASTDSTTETSEAGSSQSVAAACGVLRTQLKSGHALGAEVLANGTLDMDKAAAEMTTWAKSFATALAGVKNQDVKKSAAKVSKAATALANTLEKAAKDGDSVKDVLSGDELGTLTTAMIDLQTTCAGQF